MSKKETLYPLNTLGGRIQALRLEDGKSRPEFYDLVKDVVSTNDAASKSRTIKGWESGRYEMSHEELNTICDYFEVSSDYLLGRKTARNYDIEFISEYTGLSVSAIESLHSDVKFIKKTNDILKKSEHSGDMKNPKCLIMQAKNTITQQKLSFLSFLVGESELLEAIHKYLYTGQKKIEHVRIGFDDERQSQEYDDHINSFSINGITITPAIISQTMREAIIGALNKVQSKKKVPSYTEPFTEEFRQKFSFIQRNTH